MKKTHTKTIIALVIVIALTLLSSIPLFKSGYFTMHDDVQVMRLYEMERCFQDGQIPCRWVPDMGANYGHPLFNYHPVFSYYVGTLFRPLGLSFITISKLLFFLTYLLSAIFMFFLGQSLFGAFAGIAAAIFFVFAPYHALDVYVRGAMTESWGIVFFPAIFYSLFNLAKEPKKPAYLVLTVLSLSGLFLSHNIMTLLFTPIAFAWGLYWFVANKKLRQAQYLIIGFAWAVGLSAFFLLPAFLEKSLVKIDTLTSDYYNFRHHFAAVRQLFLDRSWGYGPSQPGPEDMLSFQLGWPHWLLSFSGIAVAVYSVLKKKWRSALVGVFATGLYLGAIFMTHSKSVGIWELLPIISFVQFPWRFLGIAMFGGAILTGLLFTAIPRRHRPLATLLISLFIITMNIQYFKPQKTYPNMTDELKLSGEEYRIQSLATLLDYIPTQVVDNPTDLAPTEPWVVEGEAKITEFAKRSNFWRFTIENSSDKPALVRVPVFNFPNWIVLLDQQPIEFTDNNPTAVIEFNIPPGKHTAVGRFSNTPLRSTADIITLASFALLVMYTVHSSRKSA